MTTRYTKYCLPYRLPCANAVRKDIILCLQSADLIVQPDPACLIPVTTIEAQVCQAYTLCDSCQGNIWNYTFSYDDTQLTNPTTPLIAGDIVGVFCKDCQTDWTEQLLNCAIQPLPCVTDTSTINLGFDGSGCLTADVIGPEFPVANETDLIAGISGSKNMVIWGPVTLTADRTISTSVRVINGGSFITSGHILTFNGSFNSGDFKCFTTSGSEVVFGPSSVLYILLEWFGAVGDGTTDDTAAIQLAFNRAATPVTNVIVVQPLNKTYSISTIVCPRGLVVKTPYPKRSYAIFKARAASAMFTITSLSDSFVTFEGVTFDSNALATSNISVVSSDNIYIKRCSFKGSGAKALSLNGCIFGYFQELEFVGTYTTDSIIYITGLSNANYIERCNFSSPSANYNVFADSSWTGDTLLISDCAMGTSNCIAAISLIGNVGISHVSSMIRNVRIDQHASTAHIIIGQYAWGVDIFGCDIVDSAPYNVLSDAGYTSVHDNWLAQATVAAIGLTTNSNNCRIGTNTNNGGFRYVVDTSLYQGLYHLNIIDRHIGKGVTADRAFGVPGGSFGPYEYGVLYLDTTLDADGKPIWWNGVAWVDATGAVV